MRGFKFSNLIFAASAFISNFFLIFLTSLAVMGAGDNLPVLFYAICMIPIAYGYFDVFRGFEQRKYVAGAVSASLVMVLSINAVVFLKNSISGFRELVSSFLPFPSLGFIDGNLYFVSMILVFNSTALLLYAWKEEFSEYRYLLIYMVPILLYLGLRMI
jgi:hypothetical protein